MKSILKKIVKLIVKSNTLKVKRNVYETKFKKNVLISYIIDPFFTKKENFKHSNWNESRIISKIFYELGYNVDIIDYRFIGNMNLAKYDIIFGFGDKFEESFYDNNCRARKIYYATGAHVNFQNNAELKRIIELKKRKDVLLKPKRIVNKNWSCSTTLSDEIFCIGNDWTSSTYKKYFEGEIRNIPVTVSNELLKKYENIQRNIKEAKNKFLWIGSKGLVHKGLDLCIEVFKDLPTLELHICGFKEDDFFKIYETEINDSKNIFYHGFIDVSSDKFIEILRKCMYCIYPTSSEGQAGSLITSMAGGLIPIATKESGIDISKFGLIIKDTCIEEIKKDILEISNWDEQLLINKSEDILDYIKKNHSENKFKEIFSHNLNEFILKERKL